MRTEQIDKIYRFARGQGTILTELLLPDRVLYQAEVINALNEGVDENVVKKYLTDNAYSLIEELAEYPFLLYPDQYTRRTQTARREITEGLARQRINRYRSPFAGWSRYNVEGAFKKRRGITVVDESTRIVRIMFLIRSRYQNRATEERCSDVLRALFFWILSRDTRLEDSIPWGEPERDKFLNEHEPVSEHKRQFIMEYYPSITREVCRWIDDCALFLFGYLTRRFWQRVL